MLQLTNEGTTPIDSVQVRTSHPAFSTVGVVPDEPDPELPSALPETTSASCGEADWVGAGGVTDICDEGAWEASPHIAPTHMAFLQCPEKNHTAHPIGGDGHTTSFAPGKSKAKNQSKPSNVR